jgi:hypothetical protein
LKLLRQKMLQQALNSLIPFVLGGAGYKFISLAYNNKFRTKGIEMQIIEELRAEIGELRNRVDSVQHELDTCKRDFYVLMEKYLGIVRD